ncbi:unnamed protein product [Heterobilharzia americana]|nr:unnamed protein product [Heterobilharzia americana]
MNKMFTEWLIVLLITMTHSELLSTMNPNYEIFEDFNPSLTTPISRVAYLKQLLRSLSSDLLQPEYLDTVRLNDIISKYHQFINNHYPLPSQSKQSHRSITLKDSYINPSRYVKRVLANYKRQAILADYKRSTHRNVPWLNYK